jgi:hypothetical protein
LPIVSLTREPAYADKLRAYTIFVDGEAHGSIKERQTVELDIPTGHHHIWLQIDWARSNLLFANVTEDMELRCRSNMKPLMAIFALSKPADWVKIWKV